MKKMYYIFLFVLTIISGHSHARAEMPLDNECVENIGVYKHKALILLDMAANPQIDYDENVRDRARDFSKEIAKCPDNQKIVLRSVSNLFVETQIYAMYDLLKALEESGSSGKPPVVTLSPRTKEGYGKLKIEGISDQITGGGEVAKEFIEKDFKMFPSLSEQDRSMFIAGLDMANQDSIKRMSRVMDSLFPQK